MAEFEVVNAHWGDRDGERHRFEKGEVREGDPEDPDIRGHLKWGHLVPKDEAPSPPAPLPGGEGGEKKD